MRVYFITISFICAISINACSQSTGKVSPRCEDAAFDKEVKRYLDFSIPVISCDELAENYSQYVLLDAREFEEYKISHLPGAEHLGYKEIDNQVLDNIQKDQAIVVYCSIGYRSEKVAEKLKEKGFSNVSNLYGSIFEWVNQNNNVVNEQNMDVKEVHGYNKKWSKWVLNPTFKTVY